MTTTLDLAKRSVRDVNGAFHALHGSRESSSWKIVNPHGLHNIAVGLDAPLDVEIEGHVGYYCAGMNKLATVAIRGNAGPGIAENMMSGCVRVAGSASQYAAATAHGGLLVIEGSSSSRCGISLKGADVVVRQDVGHMSAFMAQRGRLVICGDAGEALGDSLYEARIYLRGKVVRLGVDCVEKPMEAEHREELEELLDKAGMAGVKPGEFRRYGSARALYNFSVDNVELY